MNFEKRVPAWGNVGAEPNTELKENGFRAGYKPPAAYFNWFFNRISESVKELQEKLAGLKALAFKDKAGDADITDISAGKITQDRTHRMITDTERVKWNQMAHTTNVTLTAAGWTGSAAPYTQTVNILGATADLEPLLVGALANGASAAAQKAYLKAFGIVASGTATIGNGTATFKVYKKPTDTIIVGLKGV